MNKVVKTVKTYDYGNGVFVEKENGEIKRYWISDGRIPFNTQNGGLRVDVYGDVHAGKIIAVDTPFSFEDLMGRYCYFVDPVKLNTVVLWKTKTRLLKGIPKIIKNNRDAFLQLMAIHKDSVEIVKPLADIQKEMDETNRELIKRQKEIYGPGPVSEEMAQREAELEEFRKKPDYRGITCGRFVQPTIKSFSESENARVQSLANTLGINIENILPDAGSGTITVSWLVDKIKKEAAERDERKYKTVPLVKSEELIVNELDDGNKPLDIVDPPNMDMLKKAHEKQKQTLEQLFNTINKDIERRDRRTQLVSITERAQDKYGTLFNCIRIFGSQNDEKILAQHIDYLDLHEPVENGFDVAIAILQTRECAREELNVVKNLLSDDEVIYLLGVLQDVI